MLLDLKKTELELKKRLNYDYKWGRKQADNWDEKTKFIYEINYFEELLNKVKALDDDLKNYALNRWYNFLSAKAVEHLFSNHHQVNPQKNPRDKEIDFHLEQIPFDHKTSVFPKGFKQNYDYAVQNKKELILWLYQNQSQQGRQHFKNRLFVIVHDREKSEHWKLKAEIFLLKEKIDDYINNFKVENLIKIKYNGQMIFSDIIFVEN